MYVHDAFEIVLIFFDRKFSGYKNKVLYAQNAFYQGFFVEKKHFPNGSFAEVMSNITARISGVYTFS